MIKTIIKETFIMILLCVAIILILGILFYDYIPSNKVVPVKEAYETPNDVKEEVNEQITEIEKTEISYEVTEKDLKLYKQTSSYKPGKPDPFADLTNETTNTNVNNENNNTNTVGNTDKNGTTNSTNTFFNDEFGYK